MVIPPHFRRREHEVTKDHEDGNGRGKQNGVASGDGVDTIVRLICAEFFFVLRVM